MHTLESAQSFQGHAGDLGKFEIELGNFIAGLFAGVGDGYGEGNRVTRGDVAGGTVSCCRRNSCS